MLMDERRGAGEAYEAACNTSSLVVDSRRTGAPDWLMASAWSPSRIGGALRRLHSEYHGAAKGRTATDAALLRQSLRSLTAVVEQAALHAQSWGMQAGQAREVVLWSLDPVCVHCQGRGQLRIAGTPMLGAICRRCRGTGRTRPPHGEHGQRLAESLARCLASHEGALRKAFRR